MADGPGKPLYENMKTRRVRIVWCNFQFRDCTAMNGKKSPQNRYCCVPLCNQKGSTGPNGEKVGFFNLPTDRSARDQWLHAILRDMGKHFITDATKIFSLHFKKEHLRKSMGIGRLCYVDGEVPSVFA